MIRIAANSLLGLIVKLFPVLRSQTRCHQQPTSTAGSQPKPMGICSPPDLDFKIGAMRPKIWLSSKPN